MASRDRGIQRKGLDYLLAMTLFPSFELY